MADGIAENGGRHGGQKNNKNIHININKTLKKNNGLHSNKLKKFHEFTQITKYQHQINSFKSSK